MKFEKVTYELVFVKERNIHMRIAVNVYRNHSLVTLQHTCTVNLREQMFLASVVDNRIKLPDFVSLTRIIRRLDVRNITRQHGRSYVSVRLSKHQHPTCNAHEEDSGNRFVWVANYPQIQLGSVCLFRRVKRDGV